MQNEGGKSKLRPYKKARKFVRAQKLESVDAWREYCKLGQKPDDIPSNPNRYKEFMGYGDWLGNGKTSSLNRWPYEKSSAYVQKLKIYRTDMMDFLNRSKQLLVKITRNKLFRQLNS